MKTLKDVRRIRNFASVLIELARKTEENKLFAKNYSRQLELVKDVICKEQKISRQELPDLSMETKLGPEAKKRLKELLKVVQGRYPNFIP